MIFHYDHITFPLPEGHRFPIEKYTLLCHRLMAEKLVPEAELLAPTPVTEANLLKAHTADYIDKVLNGRLFPAEIRRIGLPWSPELVERVHYSVGATIAACRSALIDGVAVSLGGGTHHG